MSTITVTTQAELDAALVAADTEAEWTDIHIRSDAGVWLYLTRTPDSSSVVALGSSRVVAWDSSSVVAGDYVAVHLHSARATIDGGVLIDVTALDESDPIQWASYHGAKVSDGSLVLYKAVDADLKSERGFLYPIGETVEAADWRADNACCGGLHLSPSPSCAQAYYPSASRFLRCEVDPQDVRPIPGGVAKAKARRVRVVAEVDIHGDEVTA